LTILALSAPSADLAAAEVVEFADGRYLEVRSHAVEGEYLRLTVDDGSFLIFPAYQVDTIREDWQVVYRYRPAGVDRATDRGRSGRSEVLTSNSRIVGAAGRLGVATSGG
jgi:hypothetical protein